MVKHNHGNAPLTGTYTDNECGFVADQNSKKKNLQSKTEADKRGYTLELTSEETRFLFQLLSDNQKEFNREIWLNGSPSPNIPAIAKKIEIIKNIKAELMEAIKKQANIGFALEKEEKQFKESDMEELPSDFANILAKHNTKGKRKKTRW